MDLSSILNEAVAHQRAGRAREAEAMFRQVLARDPHRGDGWRHLGILLFSQGRIDEAIGAFDRAVALRPGDADTHLKLGNALYVRGAPEQAIAAYRRALAVQPNLADAHYNIGNVFASQGRMDEAADEYRRALAIRPNFADALANLGSALKDLGQLDQAVACYRRSEALHPDPAVGSNLLFTLQYHPGYDAKQILDEHRRWDVQYARLLTPANPVHPNDRAPDRRLRIGYVCADLRDHPVGRSMLPLLEHRDRAAFEVFCYGDVVAPDTVTQRLAASADAWRNTLGFSDEQLAQLIRNDRIDMLLDFTMHMAGNRLLAFARKPAPVQITWQAYPGTTGLGAMDYRLSDPYIDPPGADENYSEKTVRLPDSFWIYHPLGNEPSVNDLPARQRGYITFGCLNNFCKVNDTVLELWAQVLGAVPGSHLLMLAPPGSPRQRVLATLGGRGIHAGRIEFVSHQPRESYLHTYHRIDIGLDTFPYNGHMTSLDSFWMGVPVVTLIGRAVVGRAGLSQLCNLGLKELAGDAFDQFVQIAANLGADLPRLAEVRSTLRPRMAASPLLDTRRFTRTAEAAYRKMWRAWCGAVGD